MDKEKQTTIQIRVGRPMYWGSHLSVYKKAFCSDDFCVIPLFFIIIIISENYPELENKMELLASQHVILVGLKSNQIQ